MKAEALCHGAATIITGFATGKGAAYGLGLQNKTSVELNDSGGVESIVNKEEGVGVELAKSSVKRVLDRFQCEFSGARVVTESEIPVAAGLKSSSVAANSIALATLGALANERGEVEKIKFSKDLISQRIILEGREIEPEEIINLGIDAAFDAKVTATGALDDASASFLGGYTITDNLKRRIVYHGGMEELDAVVYLPGGKSYSGQIKKEQLKSFAREVDLVWEQARNGRLYSAITLNGMIHSVVFRQSMESTLKALDAGAIACGLSGTGPAVVALTRKDPKAIKDAWSGLEGEVMVTKTNNEPAKVIK